MGRGEHRFPFAPDHQAVAAIEAPNAAARAAIDMVNAFAPEVFSPPHVVSVEGVPAVYDGVAGIEKLAQLRDRVLGDLFRPAT